MDEADLTAVVKAGQELLADKYFMNSMHVLWIYDYFLTFGDEVNYAWSGKKNFGFLLFLAVRYSPVLYIVWVNITMFQYSEPSCQESKLIAVLHVTIVTVLAQIAIALRAYAVTKKNTLLGAVLAVLITAQLMSGVLLITKTAVSPLERLPEINTDAYKVCLSGPWYVGGYLFTILAIVFDIFTFSIIFVTVKRRGPTYPGVPSLLNIIQRDATLYFILIFACQFCLLLFLFLTPASIRLMPGVAATILIPIMVSRMTLSLKEASLKPIARWSPENAVESGARCSMEGTASHLPLRAFAGS